MDWFTELTGLPDDRPETVRAGIGLQGDWLVCRRNDRRMRMGRLTTPSLAQLRQAYGAPDNGAASTVREVVADAAALHADPANAGAVFQVASQFNLLEMIGPDVTPEQGIARYAHDATQGPACAMACAAGTIWRNYLVPIGGKPGQDTHRQLDMAAPLHRALAGEGGPLWRMQNGYLLPHPGGLTRAAGVIGAGEADALRRLLQLGVQADTEVTLPGAGHTVTQVYASAAPVAYAPEPGWEPLARLILEAAYEATLQVALGVAGQGGSNQVFLTLLGGGAFGNRPDWIMEALARALQLYQRAGLDIVIVSYRQPNPDLAPLLTA